MTGGGEDVGGGVKSGGGRGKMGRGGGGGREIRWRNAVFGL